jgi:hypothetical protein
MTSDIAISARPKAPGTLQVFPVVRRLSCWQILSRSSKEMLLAEPS